MKILSWNCHGFLGKETRDHLMHLNNIHSPDIIFLSETKINDNRILNLTNGLILPNKSYVPFVGQAGGIILLWKDGFTLEILNSSSNMFHALVKNDPSKGEWFLSCLYGTSYTNEQPAQWDYIKRLSTLVNIPWVLLGDINITMNDSERNTNTEFTTPEVLESFRESDLHDLGFSRNPFTGTSNSHGTGRIKSRLDRALVNSEWTLSYPDSKLLHLTQKGSDHLPIILTMYNKPSQSGKNWKFFKHWLQNNSCRDTIMNAWNSNKTGSAAFIFFDKLSNTRHILSQWSKNIFGEINSKVTSLQQELSHLQETDVQGSNIADVLRLEKEIDALNEIQSRYNRQKSRDHFYNDMDKYSKYFHIRENQIRIRNKIDSLQAADGSWCQDRSSIESLLVSHFKNISSTSNPSVSSVFLQHISSCISEQDNVELVAIHTKLEIHQALMTIEPWTSPGPDGFPPGFYQSQWKILK
ncbi:uncharacterized protein LOC113352521 [Papaver somniferum]|uniref:uncharacterized protein LOC113352521 n=1 Tax=Papaver somniferum TaxID=3469 RepID=UPI000E704F06|nr:uncharacterized protein LOC113352521 [Papaver somniferum]